MNDQMKQIMRLRDSANFLGYEFLSWCFLLLDREDSGRLVDSITKDLLFKTELRIVLGQSMVTCLLNHKEQKTSLRNPLLEESHEAFASLRNGHVIESLALALNMGELALTVVLHAQDFGLSQVKIKNAFDSENLSDGEDELNEQERNREEIFLRMAALDDAERIINALYEHFLSLRLNDSSYSQELKLMRSQIEGRLGGYLANKEVALPSRSKPAEIAI
jgi:hypothetical protein